MSEVRDTVRVLHVDDDPNLADLATTFLEREDDRFDTETATSASEGLKRLPEREFDCIISDHDMPGQSGIEFLEAVREDHPDLPFILYTGKGSEEVASEAISKEATDYLQKGSGTEQYELLANRVRNAVEQYRSTQDAKQTRRRLQTLAESTSHCVWMFDRDWEELLFISGYEEVWNQPTETIRDNPQDFLNSVHPADRDFVRDAMEQMSNGEPIDIEYRIQRGNGERGWVWVQGEPTFDDDGRVKSVVGFTRDITGRKRRQRELERYVRIVENLPVGVFRTTPDGEFIDVNEQYVSVLDAESKSDFADFDAQEFWADQDDREMLLRQLEQEGVVEDREVEIETLDGDSKCIETTLRITEESGDRYLDGIAHDITEQREQRRQFEQAETMFENAQDSLFLIDVSEEFTVERVNPAYEEATGLSNDVLSGRTPRDILGDEQGAEIEQKYHECVEQRTALEYEETLSINGGESYWETRIAPVVIDGEVEKIVGATRDITDRKERERELRQTTARLEALFENSPVMMNVHDMDGNLIDPNPRLCEKTGFDASELTEMKVWDLDQAIDPDEAHAMWEGMEVGDRYQMEGVYQRRDGSTFPVEVHIRRLRFEGQDRFIAIAWDMTERKERERELQRYEAYLEESSDIITVLDDTGTIKYQSPAVKRVLGHERDEFVGQNGSDYIHPDDEEEVWEMFTDLVADPEARVTVQCRFRTADDDWRWLEVRGTNRLEHEAINGIVTNNRDITEQKRREQQLERQNERFDELASAVSHDLQTPLATARGRAELAIETGDTEQMEQARTALERTDQLREDLVDVLRTKEIVDETEPVDIQQVGQAAWETVSTPEDASLQVRDAANVKADPDALRRLFENLLSNAVEHGNGDITVRIGEIDDGFFAEDNGPGIPENERDEVFTPGYSTKSGGSGVGLASVRQIVMAHSWDIHVTDSSEGGARFEITGIEADQ